MSIPPEKKSREHQANERTFLAWVRTSIAIMAFGFVVEKFSLFLKQLTVLLGKTSEPITSGYSAILGVVLVGFGLLIAALAFFQYRSVEKQLNRDTFRSSRWLPVILISFIQLIGVVLLVYLIQSH